MANNINIVITAEDKASKPLRAITDGFDTGASKSNAFKGALEALGRSAQVAIGIQLSKGIDAMKDWASYSFNATREVQGYVAGIQSLTSNTAEASSVIKDMVGYVQGKPFDRIDTIKAASQLLGMGRTAQQTKSDIELLGKAVLVSGSDWAGLTKIYGQVMGSGKLNLELFDQMANRLPALTKGLAKEMGVSIGDVRDQLTGTTVDASVFRRAMENALPDSVIAASSNTIDNKLLSLKTSFRSLGFAVLGVDFSKLDGEGQPLVKSGGLLDRMIDGFSGLTTFLRTPQVTGAFSGLGEGIVQLSAKAADLMPKLGELAGKVGDFLQPKLVSLWETVEQKLFPSLSKLWKQVLEPLVPIIGATLVQAIGALIDIFTIALTAVSPFISFLADNTWVIWGVVSAVLAFKSVMILDAVFASATALFTAFSTVTLPAAGLAFTTFKALVASPIVMPAIAIGAAIAAIALVWQKYQDTMAAIENGQRQLKQSQDATAQIQQKYYAARDSGNKAEADKYFKLYMSALDSDIGILNQQSKNRMFASGTNSAPGGWSLVGEHGPELRKLGQGDEVIPAYRTRSQDAPQSSSPSVVIQNYNSYSQSDDNRFFRDLGFYLELAS